LSYLETNAINRNPKLGEDFLSLKNVNEFLVTTKTTGSRF